MNFLYQHLLGRVLHAAIFFATFFFGITANAQSGTYQLKNKNGSYCNISLLKKGNYVTAEIFAWWNTPSAQTGSYYGKGTLSANNLTLKSVENEPECKVTLALEQNKLRASFENCAVDHLPEDFNGLYHKITVVTAGDYVVSVPKSYFHKKPNDAAKLKSYVVGGNHVTLNLDRIEAGNWVYVYYVDPSGKESAGYLSLAHLKKLEK